MFARVAVLLAALLALLATGAWAQNSLAAPLPGDSWIQGKNWVDIGKSFSPKISAMLWWKEGLAGMDFGLVFPARYWIGFGRTESNVTDLHVAYGVNGTYPLTTVVDAVAFGFNSTFSTEGCGNHSQANGLVCRDGALFDGVSGCNNDVVVNSLNGNAYHVTSTISGEVFNWVTYTVPYVTNSKTNGTITSGDEFCDQERDHTVLQNYRFVYGDWKVNSTGTWGDFTTISSFDRQMKFTSPSFVEPSTTGPLKDSGTRRQGAVAGIICGLLFGLLALTGIIAGVLVYFT